MHTQSATPNQYLPPSKRLEDHMDIKDNFMAKAKHLRAELWAKLNGDLDEDVYITHVRSRTPQVAPKRIAIERLVDWLGERFRLSTEDEIAAYKADFNARTDALKAAEQKAKNPNHEFMSTLAELAKQGVESKIKKS